MQLSVANFHYKKQRCCCDATAPLDFVDKLDFVKWKCVKYHFPKIKTFNIYYIQYLHFLEKCFHNLHKVLCGGINKFCIGEMRTAVGIIRD